MHTAFAALRDDSTGQGRPGRAGNAAGSRYFRRSSFSAANSSREGAPPIRPGSSSGCVSVRTIRCDPVARDLPQSARQQTQVAPCAPGFDCRSAQLSSETGARVLRRWSCASKCDSRVAGLRVALRFAKRSTVFHKHRTGYRTKSALEPLWEPRSSLRVPATLANLM